MFVASKFPVPDGDTPDSSQTCAHRLFERQAERSPEAVAARFGDEAKTYRRMNAWANRIANRLRRLGLGQGDLVGVAMQRTPALLAGLLGVWKAGAAYVPLDPAYPARHLAFMATDAGVRLILTDRQSSAACEGIPGDCLCLDGDGSALGGESEDNPSQRNGLDDIAYVMYTSGSTGQPKGAAITHGGLSNYLRWAVEAYGLEPGDSVPVHSSISFDLTVTSLYPPLLVGGHVDLLPDEAGAQHLINALRRGPCRGLVKITPAHLELLSQEFSPAEVGKLTRVFVIGGEALRAEQLRLWRRHAPATRLINEYGPTETVVGCCVHEVAATDPDTGPIPIGRPIANTHLYVLDAGLRPVPSGTVGELYIGGAGVARGYLGRPELTRQRFLADPFAGGASAHMYKSGDLARWRDDGVLEYHGRADDQVKVRGYRIEPGEIEARLAAHEDVQTCVVVARPDAAGEKQLVAYFVPRSNRSPGVEDLRSFLLASLPDYMVPMRYVQLEAFPLTQNGKVDRQALPDPATAIQASDYIAPQTAVEIRLAEIWARILKIDRIGTRDDVFDLGAHSLQTVRAASEIRSAFGIDLQIRHIFERPTIAGLAEVITGLTWLSESRETGAGAAEREELLI